MHVHVQPLTAMIVPETPRTQASHGNSPLLGLDRPQIDAHLSALICQAEHLNRRGRS
jgi:hypothetical protein